MSAIDDYKRELNRIAWRIQYRVKKERKHEILTKVERVTTISSFTDQADNRLLVQHLLNSLSSETGKTIIYELYINDKTEAEIAQDLQISQQAVNKWKRKMIQQLSQMRSL